MRKMSENHYLQMLNGPRSAASLQYRRQLTSGYKPYTSPILRDTAVKIGGSTQCLSPRDQDSASVWTVTSDLLGWYGFVFPYHRVRLHLTR